MRGVENSHRHSVFFNNISGEAFISLANIEYPLKKTTVFKNALLCIALYPPLFYIHI